MSFKDDFFAMIGAMYDDKLEKLEIKLFASFDQQIEPLFERIGRLEHYNNKTASIWADHQETIDAQEDRIGKLEKMVSALESADSDHCDTYLNWADRVERLEKDNKTIRIEQDQAGAFEGENRDRIEALEERANKVHERLEALEKKEQGRSWMETTVMQGKKLIKE